MNFLIIWMYEESFDIIISLIISLIYIYTAVLIIYLNAFVYMGCYLYTNLTYTYNFNIIQCNIIISNNNKQTRNFHTVKTTNLTYKIIQHIFQ